MTKKKLKRNYFVVLDGTEEMWKAVEFAMVRAKSIKGNITTISFAESISDQMLLTSTTENIINKDQINLEKEKHKKVHSYLLKKCKIKADMKVFLSSNLDEFINYLNNFSSNSSIILASSEEIGKPGPLIDKLIYEKSNLLKCPLMIISGSLSDKELGKIV